MRIYKKKLIFILLKKCNKCKLYKVRNTAVLINNNFLFSKIKLFILIVCVNF